MVSCGGYHQQRWQTTTGSALDWKVFDSVQMLSYIVHNMSRFGQFGGFMVKLCFICWFYCLSSGWHVIAEWGFVSMLWFNSVILNSLCKLVQGLFSKDLSARWGIVICGLFVSKSMLNVINRLAHLKMVWLGPLFAPLKFRNREVISSHML